MHPETTDALTIRDMAARSGLSEHTLRYYERIGLIHAIPRDTSSGHRRYSPETAQLVESLACLRATGLTLEDMRTFLVFTPRAMPPPPSRKLRSPPTRRPSKRR